MNTTSRYPNAASVCEIGACAPKANRELQVPAELGRLSTVLDEHEKMIAVLSERVSPLLRPEPPEACAIEKEATELALAPIADRLRSYRRHVERLNGQLQGLVNRCEV